MLKRLPSRADAIAVFSVVASLVYAWTLLAFIWKLPAWILFLTSGEMLGTLAYVLTWALFESLLVFGFIVLVGLVLPPDRFRDTFLVRGTWLALSGYGLMILSLRLSSIWDFIAANIFAWTAGIALLAILLTYFSARLKPMRVIAEWVSDRFQIFLFILLPASLVSLLAVIIRNLF